MSEHIQATKDENDESIENHQRARTSIAVHSGSPVPRACGLYSRNPVSQCLRGRRKSASPDVDWENLVYIVNYPEDNTREMEEKGVSSAVKVE